jgi:hypothetical protein
MRTYVRLLLAMPLVTCVLVGAGGCGKSEPLYPVSGKVTMKTGALKGGVVTFVPDEAKGNKSKLSPTGKITSDGTYSLTTEGRSGAPLGHYKVTVNPDTPGMGGGTTPDPNKPSVGLTNPEATKIDPSYKDPSRTPLQREVVASAPAGKYDLEVK